MGNIGRQISELPNNESKTEVCRGKTPTYFVYFVSRREASRVCESEGPACNLKVCIRHWVVLSGLCKVDNILGDPGAVSRGRAKWRDESFQEWAEEPLGTKSHRTISKRLREYRLLIGHDFYPIVRFITINCPWVSEDGLTRETDCSRQGSLKKCES